MEQKFFRCSHCGNIVAKVYDAGVPVMCCGQKMQQLEPNTTEASQEKHLPVISQNGNTITVSVGSISHPMSQEHLIEWISIQTKHGNQRKVLVAEQQPVVQFALLDGDEIEAVYAYCNLHGLWKI